MNYTNNMTTINPYTIKNFMKNLTKTIKENSPKKKKKTDILINFSIHN